MALQKKMFLKDQGITIDANNFWKLFQNAKDFAKKYKVTNDELLIRYNYKEIKNEKHPDTI